MREGDNVNVYSERISLESIRTVYRNLRENYEYRLRYDEAGEFFKREMELKRRYLEVTSGSTSKVKRNSWFRRHFSLTGLYYHLSRYGEDLVRPTITGVVIVFLSTLFWLTQTNPFHEPSFSQIAGITQMGNHTQWQKAFERSFVDFLPLLPIGNKVEVGLLDYVIKTIGGVLTFGLIAIALRRKFERKYTR